MDHSATYSAADDKLRIYPAYRLPPEEYQQVKAAGFSWAPKQELFFAVWSPAREDVALELAEDIEDEDITPQERAAIRAERFETYSGNADRRAESARKAVDTLADGIPLGQPILVGHHSERHARKDAERIQNGMRRLVDEMKRADYWQDRAQAALHHAERMERPDVIARRIKTLEAERRKCEKNTKEAAAFLKLWQAPNLDTDKAKAIANYDHIYKKFPLSEYPRTVHTYEGEMSLWSALDDGFITAVQAQAIAVPVHERTLAHNQRWIEHLDNRLLYERALLAEKGGIPADKKPLEVGGAIIAAQPFGGAWLEITRLNKSGGEVVSVTTTQHPAVSWRRREIVKLDEIRDVLTKAEYEERGKPKYPSAKESEHQPVYKPPEPKPWEEIEKAAEQVQAVSAPELFPTPAPIIARMLEEAEPAIVACLERDGCAYMLEPSAGTGVIVRALAERFPENRHAFVNWCEIDSRMRDALQKSPQAYGYAGDDFLALVAPNGYTAVVMNPPFSAEVEHVRHAYDVTRPGGVVVSVMSEHPFHASDRKSADFRAWLDNHGGVSEKLPEGSFLPATGIHTRLVVIRKPEPKPAPVVVEPEPQPVAILAPVVEEPEPMPAAVPVIFKTRKGATIDASAFCGALFDLSA